MPKSISFVSWLMAPLHCSGHCFRLLLCAEAKTSLSQSLLLALRQSFARFLFLLGTLESGALPLMFSFMEKYAFWAILL